MKSKLIALSRKYAAALRTHLKRGPQASLHVALRLGREAVGFGLETLELARIHEQALTALELSKGKSSEIKRAELFFTEAITPIVETHRAARQSKSQLSRLTATLDRRTAELAATNRQLKQGVVRRKNVEAALEKSGQHYRKLLKDSLQIEEGLRRLTRQVLAAQEEERRKMSRELQDEIAQTLLGINVRLLTLKREARNNTKGFRIGVANAQRLVRKSVGSARQAASKLRKA